MKEREIGDKTRGGGAPSSSVASVLTKKNRNWIKEPK